MKITMDSIPPETTFEAPEGNYFGELQSVFLTDQTTDGTTKQTIRFVFKLNIPSICDRSVLVGKNLEPSSTKLRQFLERWLGRQFLKSIAGTAFDFDDLIGTKADITVVHINNDGYDKPYRNLAGAYPVGTLELTEAPEKATTASNQLVETKKYVVPARLANHISVMPFAAPYGCKDITGC